MEKNYLSQNTYTKEKEFTLSLFRIPLSFFAEDSKPTANEKTQKEAPQKESPQKVKLDKNNNSSTVTLNFDTDFNNNSTIAISSEEKASTKNSTSSEAPQDEKTTTASQVASASSTTPTQPLTKSRSRQAPNSTPSNSHSTPSPSSNASESASNQNDNKKPAEEPTKVNKPSSGSDTPSGNDNTEKTPNVPNNKPKNVPSSQDDNPKDSPSTGGAKSPTKPKDSKLQNELDRLNDKFLKPKPKGQQKGKLPDKIAPKLPGKANDIKNKLQTAKKYADIGREIAEDPGKAAEMVGDAAVKAAALAGNSIAPGLGTAISKVDKIAGNTEIGKKSKKAIGCCACGGCALGCLLPLLLILFLLLYLISSFSWALRWFGLEEDFTGIDFEEYMEIQDASYADFSLQDLINEIELGSTEAYNIQNIFTAVLTNKNPRNPTENKSTYSYLKDDVEKYNTEYEDLIKEGKLSRLDEGDLTAFGLIFDLSLDNYTATNLKLPSLAPERQKDNIVYQTYDPSGKHQALFEDVLNNMQSLINRFDGQVSSEWFKTNLIDVLDKKFDVYIRNMNETRSLSLRDLFKETSKTAYDTEYDKVIVSTILTDTKNNPEIIKQFTTLQTNLASLEMMTYMLYYQIYYHEKVLLKDVFSDCDNVDIFNDEFFAQFLTFTDIEQFISLSSLTDNSFVYEIAIAGIDSLSLPPITHVNIVGNSRFAYLYQYSNWFATYNFDPHVDVNEAGGSYTYSMPCISMDKTSIQQKLFDKYNIEANFRYGTGPNDVIQRTPEENAAIFFSLFELATGIPMSVGDDGIHVPIYEVSSDGIITPNHTSTPVKGIARITLPFGTPYSDTTVARFGVDPKHKGIDYGVPTGTTVYATSSGIAYTNYGNTGYGNYIKIIHDDGYTSIYAHGNGTFYIPNGSRVSAGQPIMQSGNSGNSTGPHLHFEVRTPSGTPINPTGYIYS